MQAVPAQVQLGFTQVEGGTLQQVMVVKVKVYNASSLPSRLHLHPLTSRSVFKATLTKHSTLAPGMCDVLNIECTPLEFRYYQDKLKLSSGNGDMLEIPLEAYPIMNERVNTHPTNPFLPKNIDFGTCVICSEVVKTFELQNVIPLLSFDFEIIPIIPHPYFSIHPLKGTIAGGGTVMITVTFTPLSLCTSSCKVNLVVRGTQHQQQQYTFLPAPSSSVTTICGSATGPRAGADKMHLPQIQHPLQSHYKPVNKKSTKNRHQHPPVPSNLFAGTTDQESSCTLLTDSPLNTTTTTTLNKITAMTDTSTNASATLTNNMQTPVTSPMTPTTTSIISTSSSTNTTNTSTTTSTSTSLRCSGSPGPRSTMEVNGIVISPHVVLNTQQPAAKQKMKEIGARRSKVGGGNASSLEGGDGSGGVDSTRGRQVKELAFGRLVKANMEHERAKELKWFVCTGRLPFTEEEKQDILRERELSVPEVVQAATGTGGRVVIPATHSHARSHSTMASPSPSPSFDTRKNSAWAIRAWAIKRFVSAVRSIIVQIRARKRLESMRSFLKKFDYNKSLIADSEWSRVAPSTVVSIEGTENVVGDDDASIASLELKDSQIRYPFFPGFRTELSFIGDGQDGLGPLHAPHIKEIVQVFDELGTFELKTGNSTALEYHPFPLSSSRVGSYIPRAVSLLHPSSTLDHHASPSPINAGHAAPSLFYAGHAGVVHTGAYEEDLSTMASIQSLAVRQQHQEKQTNHLQLAADAEHLLQQDAWHGSDDDVTTRSQDHQFLGQGVVLEEPPLQDRQDTQDPEQEQEQQPQLSTSSPERSSLPSTTPYLPSLPQEFLKAPRVGPPNSVFTLDILRTAIVFASPPQTTEADIIYPLRPDLREISDQTTEDQRGMYPIHESSSGSKRRHDISGGGGPAVLNHQRNNIDANTNTNINIHININPFNSLVDQWPSPTWGTLEQAPLLLSRNDPSSSDGGGGGGSGSGGADGADDHGTPVDLATIKMQYFIPRVPSSPKEQEEEEAPSPALLSATTTNKKIDLVTRLHSLNLLITNQNNIFEW